MDYLLRMYKSKFDLDELDEIKARHGFNVIVMDAKKLVLIVLLASYFNIMLEVTCSIICFSFLRRYGYGYHAQSFWACLLISISMFVGIPCIINYYNVHYEFLFLLGIISCFLIFMIGPIESFKSKIINDNHRTYLKKRLNVVTFIYLVLIIITPIYISKIFIYSIYFLLIFLTFQYIKQIIGGFYNELNILDC